MPPEVLQALRDKLSQEAMAAFATTGQMPDQQVLREMATAMKDQAMRLLKEQAEERVNRMERKMEDQLSEGGWHKAFNEFLDDIVTFPYAVLKGPIKRRRKTLRWQNGKLVPAEEIRN